jgi:hypothetical protein
MSSPQDTTELDPNQQLAALQQQWNARQMGRPQIIMMVLAAAQWSLIYVATRPDASQEYGLINLVLACVIGFSLAMRMVDAVCMGNRMKNSGSPAALVATSKLITAIIVGLGGIMLPAQVSPGLGGDLLLMVLTALAYATVVPLFLSVMDPYPTRLEK